MFVIFIVVMLIIDTYTSGEVYFRQVHFDTCHQMHLCSQWQVGCCPHVEVYITVVQSFYNKFTFQVVTVDVHFEVRP